MKNLAESYKGIMAMQKEGAQRLTASQEDYVPVTAAT